MSASICHECEQPRDYGATLLHVCHCDETAGDLRVLIHLRDTELTRLRAALVEIAALQTEEPVNPLTEDIGPRDVYPDMDSCFEGGMTYGMRFSRFEAAEMARKGLVTP